MSWTCLESNRESIARKQHECDACGGRISPGEKQVTRSGVSGDGFYRMHMHPECELETADWDDQDWECLGGTLERPVEESEVAA